MVWARKKPTSAPSSVWRDAPELYEVLSLDVPERQAQIGLGLASLENATLKVKRWRVRSVYDGGPVQRQNQVAQKFNDSEVEWQTIQEGDLIVNVNGKTEAEEMSRLLKTAPILWLRMRREKDAVDPEKTEPETSDGPKMTVTCSYDGIEAEHGYLQVNPGEVVFVNMDSRSPPEAGKQQVPV
eukprot:Skav214585  [mRNA]  locus=scaffold57:345723:348599:+ [translate_table: standard]